MLTVRDSMDIERDHAVIVIDKEFEIRWGREVVARVSREERRSR
jgi:hypothetical protein